MTKTKLKELRERAGLSQTQLALKAGVSPRMIPKYEAGANDINKAQGITLYKIAQVLGCKVEDLLELKE